MTLRAAHLATGRRLGLAVRAMPDAGYTLAEALVSLFIFSLISVMILGVVTLQGRAEGTLRNRIDRDEAVVLAQTILRSRMDGMRSLVDIHGTGDSVAFDGRPDLLQFDAPIFQSAGPHALHHFRLRLERDGNLVLYTMNGRSLTDWRPPGNAGWNSLPLLADVARIQLTYFGPDRYTGKDAWQETWQRRRSLPKLISLRLIFPAEDPRRWPVLMVRPSPQTHLACRDENSGKDCGDST